jgi:hypothetical protein
MKLTSRIRPTWLGTASAAVILALYGQAPAAENNFSTATASISAEQLRQYIEVLANDTLEGREAGTRGGRAAAGYLIERFKQFGLKPAGTAGGYTQEFGNQYRNLLGILEGSDPVLKQQFVVVGAHYDHVGYGNQRNSRGPTGYIHNGADDNASGDAALLEIAEAFTLLESRPKRSILFALWDCEEKGLLGSRNWALSPTIPLERIEFALNLDMVGRLQNSLEIIGSRTSRNLRRLVSDQNQMSDLPLDFTWKIKSDSDHATFLERNIPILMIHTGLHDDYHRPSDDVEKINFTGLQRIAQLTFGVVHSIADEPSPWTFRAAGRYESPFGRQQMEQPLPPLPGRLGLQWDPKQDGDGPLVISVVSGSAADRGGIRVGDRLLKFNDRTLDAKTDLQELVLAAENPVQLVVKREGSEEPLDLKVHLDSTPVRLGIGWREDDAEPGSILVLRVTPGSPADKAGIRIADRIEGIDGRDFASSEDFQRQVAGAKTALKLRVERGGRSSIIVLEPAAIIPPAGAQAAQ